MTDSLLPQIAGDFGTTVGAAAMVVTAYAVAHGSVQLFIGPIGDRFGKYLTVATMCLRLPPILVMALRAGQFADRARDRPACSPAPAPAGSFRSSMAYVGDVIPYERRQPVLGRYLTGQITGPVVRPGRRRRARRPVRLAQRVLHPGRAVRARDRSALIYELVDQSAHARGRRPEERSRGFVADYKARAVATRGRAS